MKTVLVVVMTCLATIQVCAQATPPPNFDYGECVTGRINLTPDRVYTLTNEAQRYTVDRSKYDLTLDYGSVDYIAGGALLNLVPGPPGSKIAQGARFSTTHYMQYGRITGRFRPVADSGAVTTLITWSEKQALIPGTTELIQDEIDWEVVGSHPTDPQYNVFTVKSKALERTMHGGPSGAHITPNATHDFFIDWRTDRIDWGVDNQVVRSVTKANSRALTAASGMGPGDAWFPEEASRVQFSVWDGSGTGGWAGGPLNWNGRQKISAMYEYIEIQCYDHANQPVARFAVTGGSGRSSTAPNGPSSPSNATSTIPLSTLKETMTAAAAFPGSTLTANSGLGGNKPAANSALSMGLLAMSVTSGVVVAMTAALLL
ncbi:hypothetical protein BSLG_009547 [Batrachochytrium salamandrivorans]|nr:hypothetical protein BASA62_004431 [Batrachochytrium salamandrivorans]KAJ1330413.1 hypothetical protein BSLG_009547 [Batrachochytrium salamandrivorans]